jgi:SAM-dependent methyltransferase
VSPEPLFDGELLKANRRRALKIAKPGADFLLRAVMDDLEIRLSAIGRSFDRVALTDPIGIEDFSRLRTSGKFGETVPVSLGFPMESAPDDGFGCAVSLLSLQTVDDVAGALIAVRRLLKPDGLFIGALLGGGTLAELRHALIAAEGSLYGGASARVIPFADVRDGGALLQRAGLALPVADVETLVVRYANLFDLMHDLRAMGAANPLLARSRKPVSRDFFRMAAEIYAEQFGDPDGRIRATFNIVWLSGWAPHASQQKPAKPGSAQTALKDVL